MNRRNIRLLLLLLLLLVACGSAAPATSTTAQLGKATAPAASASSLAPTATASASAQKTRIIEQSAGFPRKIEALNGVITVAQKPQRVMTLSVGYDEMTLAIVDKSRIAAISQYTADPTISNVADQVAGIPIYGKGAEQVLAAKPDVVVADPFTDPDLVRQVQAAGIPVAVTDLVDAYDGFVGSIRVLAYLYGEDARGDALIRDINDRLARIDATVAKHASEPKPRILLLQGNAYVAGSDSNMDGIIRRAGGVNVAAANGISGTKQISLESIIAMNPDTIVIPGPPAKYPEAFAQVTANPALSSVPAVVNKRIFSVTDTYLFTLSQWNVRAMEELARLLYSNG